MKVTIKEQQLKTTNRQQATHVTLAVDQVKRKGIGNNEDATLIFFQVISATKTQFPLLH